jgi:inner membrane protein
LDTVAGKIRWLYPFSNKDFVLVHIPSIHSWWVWNFVMHWTFCLELGLVLSALYVWAWDWDKRDGAPND